MKEQLRKIVRETMRESVLSEMESIKLEELYEVERFTATNKASGKTSVFKSKDSRDAAIKAGTHAVKKDSSSNGDSSPKGNIFNTPSEPTTKPDVMVTADSIAAVTGMRASGIASWADENGVDLLKVSDALKSKKLNPKDMFTAVIGTPGNKFAKDIISKYSQSGVSKSEPNDTPKADPMVAANSIASATGMMASGIASWADENGVDLSKVSADIDSKKLNPKDMFTAVIGTPGNKYAKDIITKYSQSGVNKSKMESVVNESASKEAVGISVFTGTRADAVDAFINKHNLDAMKLYKSIKSANLQGRLNFVSALVGNDGNPNQRLTIKLHQKNESTITETKFIAFWNNKQHEIDGKDLWDAKQKAITMLKVPKSKVGLLAVVSAESQKRQDFKFN
jgi:hypothetical protein